MEENTFLSKVELVSNVTKEREKLISLNLKKYLTDNIENIGLTSFAYLSQIYSQQTYGPLIERKIIDLLKDETHGWKKFNKNEYKELKINGHIPTGDSIDKELKVIEIKTSFYHDGSKSYCNFVQMRKNSVDYFLLLSFNFSELNKLEEKIINNEITKEDLIKNYKDIVNIAFFPANLLNTILDKSNISSNESHTGIKNSIRVSLTNIELATTIKHIKYELNKPCNIKELQYCQPIYFKLKKEIINSNIELFNHFSNINILDKNKILSENKDLEGNSNLIKEVNKYIQKNQNKINNIIDVKCSFIQRELEYITSKDLQIKIMLLLNRNNPINLIAIKTKYNLKSETVPNINTVIKTKIWNTLTKTKIFSNKNLEKIIQEEIDNIIKSPIEINKKQLKHKLVKHEKELV